MKSIRKATIAHKKCEVVYKGIFLLGIVALPLIFWPRANVAYEVPKAWFAERWIEILGILTLVCTPKLIKKGKVDSHLTIIIIAFFCFTIISSLMGADVSKSVLGNYYRRDGLLALTHLILLFALTSLLFRKKWIVSFAKATSVGVFLTSGWTIFYGLSYYLFEEPDISNWHGAVATSFGNPNYLAGYLVVTLPLTALVIDKEKGKASKYWVISIILQSIAVLLTRSWAGVFGLILFFAAWTIIKKRKHITPISLITILVLLVFSFFYFKFKRAQKIPNRIIAESRERIFTKGLLAFRQKPLTGWGWANFDHAFESVNWPIHLEDDVYVDKAHSTILEILVTAGLPGMLLYLIILFRVIQNSMSYSPRYSKYLTLSVFLFILHSQTNIISIAEEIIFWLIAGITSKKSLSQADLE